MIDDITTFFFFRIFFPNIKNIKRKYNSIVNFSKLIFNKKILILSGAVVQLYPFWVKFAIQIDTEIRKFRVNNESKSDCFGTLSKLRQLP